MERESCQFARRLLQFLGSQSYFYVKRNIYTSITANWSADQWSILTKFIAMLLTVGCLPVSHPSKTLRAPAVLHWQRHALSASDTTNEYSSMTYEKIRNGRQRPASSAVNSQLRGEDFQKTAFVQGLLKHHFVSEQDFLNFPFLVNTNEPRLKVCNHNQTKHCNFQQNY